MKNLFLLDGAAGTGKSDCIKFIRDGYNGHFKVGVLQKYTTRPCRIEEKAEDHKVDLEFISDLQFKQIEKEEGKNFFTYRYGDDKYGYHMYGVKKSDIDASLEQNQNVFLIVRNIACIRAIMKGYADTDINVVPVYIYTDPGLVVERLKKEKYSDEAIDFRTRRSQQVWAEYLSQVVPFYKDIIINNSNPQDFYRLINQLMIKYDQEETKAEENPATLVFPCGDIARLSKYIVGHRIDIEKFLKTCDYSRNVFLMIKYRDDNLELRNELKNRFGRAGFNCILANEYNLTDDVYNPIALTYCCKYGIALFEGV